MSSFFSYVKSKFNKRKLPDFFSAVPQNIRKYVFYAPKEKIKEMSKTDTVESIKAIVSDAEDNSGNKVVNVLAKHNEYVIYEIETKDINNRIKVFIDGHTDESEENAYSGERDRSFR